MGKVFAADHTPHTVDETSTEDEISRREGDEIALFVQIGVPGQRTDLVEGVRIDELGNPLSDRQSAPFVLFCDRLGAAKLERQLALALDSFDLVLPTHGFAP